ncbi:sulfotransferase family cytosolic 1B member 1-like [Acanthaster planci]|uniref:Sulfotransferase family cytosolic 1B member 1-like n=1 Tax=Acanthaster planci TaxID=133434 RepID=A0A8B7ZCN1_ACAPL|nr:sulfotransferase family cytosolic 1B member 1-like [Acanthaster planci]
MAERTFRSLQWSDRELWYEYNGGIFLFAVVPPECWKEIEAFQARPTDICIASPGRSGSHWMSRIINLLLGFDNPDFLNDPPLENLLISAVTDPNAPQRMGYHVVAEMPSDRPRVISTHVPATHLPKSFWNTEGVKILFMLRNPFDTCRSAFKLISNLVSGPMSFSSYLKFSLDEQKLGSCTLQSLTRSYWERRHQKNLLFVYYEDLRENFRQTVTSVANFLEIPVSADQLDMIQERSSLRVMRAMEAKAQTNEGTGVGTLINKGLINKAITEYSEMDIAFVKSKIKEKLADTDIRYVEDIM